jgi:hypothetical protein
MHRKKINISTVMYGRPPLGKGIFAVTELWSGAVMYPAFVCGLMTAGPEGIRGSGSIMAAHSKCDDGAECPDPGS